MNNDITLKKSRFLTSLGPPVKIPSKKEYDPKKCDPKKHIQKFTCPKCGQNSYWCICKNITLI
jgi:hypothetical protein